jgi:hypothetical protein
VLPSAVHPHSLLAARLQALQCLVFHFDRPHIRLLLDLDGALRQETECKQGKLRVGTRLQAAAAAAVAAVGGGAPPHLLSAALVQHLVHLAKLPLPNLSVNLKAPPVSIAAQEVSGAEDRHRCPGLPPAPSN